MLTVKEWRKAKDISIVNMAEMLGVAPMTWMKWEEEPWKIPMGKFDMFCELVGAERGQVDYCQKTLQNE